MTNTHQIISRLKRVITLRRINNILSSVVMLLALYIACAPLFPNIQFWVHKTAGTQEPLVRAAQERTAGKTKVSVPMPQSPTLVIPRINLQQQIYEGDSASVLRKGVWHRPHTSTPDAGSNMVLAGHRFTYTNPEGVFYHLDKVVIGDEIIVYWQGHEYRYEVERVRVAPSDAVYIEAPTEKPTLTVYTCTPLWSAKDRLVVQAALKEQLQ